MDLYKFHKCDFKKIRSHHIINPLNSQRLSDQSNRGKQKSKWVTRSLDNKRLSLLQISTRPWHLSDGSLQAVASHNVLRILQTAELLLPFGYSVFQDTEPWRFLLSSTQWRVRKQAGGTYLAFQLPELSAGNWTGTSNRSLPFLPLSPSPPPTAGREKEDHTAQMAQAWCVWGRKNKNLRMQKSVFNRTKGKEWRMGVSESVSFDQHHHKKHLKSHYQQFNFYKITKKKGGFL